MEKLDDPSHDAYSNGNWGLGTAELCSDKIPSVAPGTSKLQPGYNSSTGDKIKSAWFHKQKRIYSTRGVAKRLFLRSDLL